MKILDKSCSPTRFRNPPLLKDYKKFFIKPIERAIRSMNNRGNVYPLNMSRKSAEYVAEKFFILLVEEAKYVAELLNEGL